MSVTLTDGQAKALQNILRDVLADKGRQAWPDSILHNAIEALQPAPGAPERDQVDAAIVRGLQASLSACPTDCVTDCRHCAPIRAAIERLKTPAPLSPFDRRAADNLADEVAVLVLRGAIDSRSLVGDALLDYRDPPCSDRARELFRSRGYSALPACVGAKSRPARPDPALSRGTPISPLNPPYVPQTIAAFQAMMQDLYPVEQTFSRRSAPSIREESTASSAREMLERLVAANAACPAEDMPAYYAEAVAFLASASPPHERVACGTFRRATAPNPTCDTCGMLRSAHGAHTAAPR